MIGQTTSAPSAFQGQNIIVLVFKSLYTSVSNITSIVGLSPLALLELIGVFVAALMVWSIINGLRGKTSFSLDPQDTPDKQEELRRAIAE